MNRVIKFRAWDKNKKEMFDPVGEMDLNNDGVMQYTGLKDKNGKDIYEGDVLKIEKEPNAEVIYGNGSFVGKEVNGWDPMADYFPLCGNIKTAEVIGNKFENPELLK
jgi:hypothetical protein